MSPIPKFSIELLAPARDASVAIAAINHGADAVYIGAPTHGARAAASNSVADIGRVCDYAHRFGARVYVTVNTIIYEEELKGVEHLIGELYRAGVDALIVQDLGILRLDIPPIALHASTQCDIRTPQRARFLQGLGFSQLVLPRELTLDEIRAMRSAVNIPLEGFIHGALCVSYSGDCRASLMCGGRSANRGECAQICRLPYDLYGVDNLLLRGKHLLSLRDLNRLDSLADMIDAGISSLKIEGRLKDAAYVKNVVSAYDDALRRLGVSRTSLGNVERTFAPDVARSFNRGFTTHFLYTPKPAPGTEINPDTPKSVGPEVARVVDVAGKRIRLSGVKAELHNGDGLNFGNQGFRVNRVEGNVIFTNEFVNGLKPGMILRRNYDKFFDDALRGDTSVRTISLSARLYRAGSQIVLSSKEGTAAIELTEPQAARTSQAEARLRVLGKLGGTIYRLDSLQDELGDEFVAASVLTALRREFITAVDAARAARFIRHLRLIENPDVIWPEGETLTMHANISNTLAESVYRSHGVSGYIQPAAEVERPQGETEVMCTRHCIRREYGKCLLTPAGSDWLEPLELRSPGLPPLSLQFDCARCRMKITVR